MRGLLDVAHRGATDFSVIIPAELLAQQQRTKRLFEIVMVAIASISLLVGGIGIMNIMLASVMERTREIGVRRAIGATRRAIVRQFLVETTLITVTGGLVGTIVGIVAVAAGGLLRRLGDRRDGHVRRGRVLRVSDDRDRLRALPRHARGQARSGGRAPLRITRASP